MNKLPFENIKREIITKKHEETYPGWGCNPEERKIEDYIAYGVINLDKPPGPTSHQVSDWVKKTLNVKKCGHGGTLDPRVVGVLPITINESTKIVRALLLAGKEYVCLMHLHKDVPNKLIKEVCKSFVGIIKQIPPLKSSVKRVERLRTVYHINILEIKGRDVLFVVGCQAGTYVRKICSDIGEKLGTGAHMYELRRTKAGPFNENERLVTLQDLKDAVYYWKEKNNEKYLRYCIQPVENAVVHLPKIWVLDSTINSLCHGAKLAVPGIAKFNDKIKKKDMVVIMSLKNELVAIGSAEMTSGEIKKNKKGIAASLLRVVMKKDTYPILWKKKTQ